MRPTLFDKTVVTLSSFHCTCKVISQVEGLDSVKLKSRSRRDETDTLNVLKMLRLPWHVDTLLSRLSVETNKSLG